MDLPTHLRFQLSLYSTFIFANGYHQKQSERLEHHLVIHRLPHVLVLWISRDKFADAKQFQPRLDLMHSPEG